MPPKVTKYNAFQHAKKMPDSAEKFLIGLLAHFQALQDSNPSAWAPQAVGNAFNLLLQHMAAESLSTDALKSVMENRTALTDGKHINEMVELFTGLLKNIQPLDIALLNDLLEKGKQAAAEIKEEEGATSSTSLKNENVIVLLGETGVGKSTMIHFLAGSTFKKEKISGKNHLTVTATNSEVIGLDHISTSAASASETDSTYAVKIPRHSEQHSATVYMTVVDTPGFGDTNGAEADIANGYCLTAAMKESRAVQPIIIISKDSLGERAKGLGKIASTLINFIKPIDAHLANISYVFTKFDDDCDIHELLKEKKKTLGREEKANSSFVKLLDDMIAKTQEKAIRLNPLTDSLEDFLSNFAVKKIRNPAEAFHNFVTPESMGALRTQLEKHKTSIAAALKGLNIPLASYKLAQLKALNQQLAIGETNDCYTECVQLLTTTVETLKAKTVTQLKSIIEDTTKDIKKVLTEFHSDISALTALEHMRLEFLSGTAKDANDLAIYAQKALSHTQSELGKKVSAEITTNNRNAAFTAEGGDVLIDRLEKMRLIVKAFSTAHSEQVAPQYVLAKEALAKALSEMAQTADAAINTEKDEYDFTSYVKSMQEIGFVAEKLNKHLPEGVDTAAIASQQTKGLVEKIKSRYSAASKMLEQKSLTPNDVKNAFACIIMFEKALQTPGMFVYVKEEHLTQGRDALVKQCAQHLKAIAESINEFYAKPDAQLTSEVINSHVQIASTMKGIPDTAVRETADQLSIDIASKLQSLASTAQNEIGKILATFENNPAPVAAMVPYQAMVAHLAKLKIIQEPLAKLDAANAAVFDNAIASILTFISRIEQKVNETDISLNNYKNLYTMGLHLAQLKQLAATFTDNAQIAEAVEKVEDALEEKILAVFPVAEAAFNTANDFELLKQFLLYMDVCKEIDIPSVKGYVASAEVEIQANRDRLFASIDATMQDSYRNILNPAHAGNPAAKAKYAKTLVFSLQKLNEFVMHYNKLAIAENAFLGDVNHSLCKAFFYVQPKDLYDRWCANKTGIFARLLAKFQETLEKDNDTGALADALMLAEAFTAVDYLLNQQEKFSLQIAPLKQKIEKLELEEQRELEVPIQGGNIEKLTNIFIQSVQQQRYTKAARVKKAIGEIVVNKAKEINGSITEGKIVIVKENLAQLRTVVSEYLKALKDMDKEDKRLHKPAGYYQDNVTGTLTVLDEQFKKRVEKNKATADQIFTKSERKPDEIKIVSTKRMKSKTAAIGAAADDSSDSDSDEGLDDDGLLGNLMTDVKEGASAMANAASTLATETATAVKDGFQNMVSNLKSMATAAAKPEPSKWALMTQIEISDVSDYFDYLIAYLQTVPTADALAHEGTLRQLYFYAQYYEKAFSATLEKEDSGKIAELMDNIQALDKVLNKVRAYFAADGCKFASKNRSFFEELKRYDNYKKDLASYRQTQWDLDEKNAILPKDLSTRDSAAKVEFFRKLHERFKLLQGGKSLGEHVDAQDSSNDRKYLEKLKRELSAIADLAAGQLSAVSTASITMLLSPDDVDSSSSAHVTQVGCKAFAQTLEILTSAAGFEEDEILTLVMDKKTKVRNSFMKSLEEQKTELMSSPALSAEQLTPFLLKLKYLERNLPEFAKNIKPLINRTLQEYKAKYGYQFLAATGVHLTKIQDNQERILAMAMIDEHPIFAGYANALRNKKTQGVTIETAVADLAKNAELKGMDAIEQAKLVQQYKSFEEQYWTLIDDARTKNNGMLLKPAEKAQAIVQGDKQPLNEKIISLLAHLFAHWTLQTYQSSGDDDRFEKDELRQPHATQLLSILRILGTDTNSPEEMVLKLQNHLAQVGTGEGKSITLGVTTAILAILGFDVDCVCYSKDLSQRDYADFKPLFEAFEIDQYIEYGTFNSLCEKLITQKYGDVRERVINFLEGQPSVVAKTSASARKKVAVVDEVDVFSDELFLGETYELLGAWSDPTIAALLASLWQARKDAPARRLTIEAVRDTATYKECLAKFPEQKSLIEEALKTLIHNLNEFRARGKDQYKVDEQGRIGTKVYDGFEYNAASYDMLWHYYHLFEQGQITREQLTAASVFLVNCASFSFTEIPNEYDHMIGATGTLEELSKEQQSFLKEKYGIAKYSYIPSSYGRSQLRFDHNDGIAIVKKDESKENPKGRFHAALQATITQRVGIEKGKFTRAGLVVFKDEEKLRAFEKSIEKNALYENRKILLESMSAEEKNSIIRQAAVSGSMVLTTRSFARGIDCSSNDDVLNGIGGMQLIPAYFPLDPAEAKQLHGRTARKGNPGAVWYVLDQEELMEELDLTEEEIGEINSASDRYAILDEKRCEIYNKKYLETQQKVEEAKVKHDTSHQLMEHLSNGETGEANKILFARNGAVYNKPGSSNVPEKIEIGIVLDATGSMSNAIVATKAAIQLMLPKLKEVLQEANDSGTPVPSTVEAIIAVYRNYSSLVINSAETTCPDITKRQRLLEYSTLTDDVNLHAQFLNTIVARDGTSYEAMEVGLQHINLYHPGVKVVMVIGDVPANTLKQVETNRASHEDAISLRVGQLTDGGERNKYYNASQNELQDYQQFAIKTHVDTEVAKLKERGVELLTVAIGTYEYTMPEYNRMMRESRKEDSTVTREPLQVVFTKDPADAMAYQQELDNTATKMATTLGDAICELAGGSNTATVDALKANLAKKMSHGFLAPTSTKKTELSAASSTAASSSSSTSSVITPMATMSMNSSSTSASSNSFIPVIVSNATSATTDTDDDDNANSSGYRTPSPTGRNE